VSVLWCCRRRSCFASIIASHVRCCGWPLLYLSGLLHSFVFKVRKFKSPVLWNLQELEATTVDGNGTETGHVIATTIGGRNGQPKQVCLHPEMSMVAKSIERDRMDKGEVSE
jgi:hypothetical protein